MTTGDQACHPARGAAALALALLGVLAACSADPQPGGMQMASMPAAGTETPVRGTQVVAGRPARVFVMAGLGANCMPIAPVIRIERQPAKGTVAFRPGQDTTIQASRNGSCIGQRIAGTGIYYTANAGQTGADTFTVVATMGADEPVTQAFSVQIAE